MPCVFLRPVLYFIYNNTDRKYHDSTSVMTNMFEKSDSMMFIRSQS